MATLAASADYGVYVYEVCALHAAVIVHCAVDIFHKMNCRNDGKLFPVSVCSLHTLLFISFFSGLAIPSIIQLKLLFFVWASAADDNFTQNCDSGFSDSHCHFYQVYLLLSVV